MEFKMFLFNNNADFLNAIAEMENYYINKPDVIYFTKSLNTYEEVKKEIYLLDNFKLINSQGYQKKKQIKITVIDGFNNKYCVTYCFNSSNNGWIYGRFNRYLRKRQNIYL